MFVFSEKPLESRVAVLRTKYHALDQAAQALRDRTWPDGLMPQTLRTEADRKALQAVLAADKALRDLIELEEQLSRCRNPLHAWRFDSRVVINFAAIGRWCARKLQGLRNPSSIRSS